jgi:hypothetical protein
MAELTAAFGVDPTDIALPEWLERWTADVSLPPSKAAAPSDWA